MPMSFRTESRILGDMTVTFTATIKEAARSSQNMPDASILEVEGNVYNNTTNEKVIAFLLIRNDQLPTNLLTSTYKFTGTLEAMPNGDLSIRVQKMELIG